MSVFIVEYTNEDCVGNQCLIMEIEAPNLETAYEIVDTEYPHLCVDTIYEGYCEEDDGQPTELEEWMDFDPDC
jgi:hypothetical protein